MGHEHALTIDFALLLGALHALEPGHGKTAMFAYLAGGRKSIWHAVVMALSTAVSHSASILFIAGLTHAVNHALTDAHADTSMLTRPLEWVSAILILSIGIFLLLQALRGKKSHACGPGCSHGGNRLSPASTRANAAIGRMDRDYKVTALLGFSGGLLPCPTAVAAYLSGVAGGSTARAFFTIVMFSAGIALGLLMVGVILKLLGSRLSRLRETKALSDRLAILRAGLILSVGGFYIVRLLK